MWRLEAVMMKQWTPSVMQNRETLIISGTIQCCYHESNLGIGDVITEIILHPLLQENIFSSDVIKDCFLSVMLYGIICHSIHCQWLHNNKDEFKR